MIHYDLADITFLNNVGKWRCSDLSDYNYPSFKTLCDDVFVSQHYEIVSMMYIDGWNFTALYKYESNE